MSRKRIIKTTQTPKSYGQPENNYPRVIIRQNKPTQIVSNSKPLASRTFKKASSVVVPPINFLSKEFTKNSKESICFVVGGGPSLNGFDFSQLNGYDTIAVNKSVEFIQNPTHFITTDYSYFLKASLPIGQIKLKCKETYFVANMSHDYMSYQNGKVVDTRRNFVYEDLYQYTGVIKSHRGDGFGSTISEFVHGNNSGHCGIQLALLRML